MTSTRKPRFKRDQTTALQLTERDKDIIKAVYQHRFLSSEQIGALLGGSRQGILRRLNLLYHGSYLDRPKIQLTRIGNQPMVYALGNKGAEFLTVEYDIPKGKVDWTTKNREAHGAFLEHTLMVAHFMALIEIACKNGKAVTHIPPQEVIDRRPIKPKAAEKDLSWKLEAKAEGRALSFSMVPDNAFGLLFPDGKAAYFFLEADRSTMPIKRSNLLRSSYYKKMVGYWESWKQKLYGPNFGFNNPRILTITISQERIDSMIEANKELDERGQGSRMFLFACEKDLSLTDPEKILEKVWLNGRGEKVSLLD